MALGYGCWLYGTVLISAVCRWAEIPALPSLAKSSAEGSFSIVPDNARREALASEKASLVVEPEPGGISASSKTVTVTVSLTPDVVTINWWILVAAVASGFCGHLVVTAAARVASRFAAAIAALRAPSRQEPLACPASASPSFSEGAPQTCAATGATGCSCSGVVEKLCGEIAALHGEVRLLRAQLLERDLKGAVRTAVSTSQHMGSSAAASSTSTGDSGGPSTPPSPSCQFAGVHSPEQPGALCLPAAEKSTQSTSEAFQAVLRDSCLQEKGTGPHEEAQAMAAFAVEVDDVAEDYDEVHSPVHSECGSTEETVVFAVSLTTPQWEHARVSSPAPQDGAPTPTAPTLEQCRTPSPDSIVEKLERDLANIIKANDALEQRLTPRGRQHTVR